MPDIGTTPYQMKDDLPAKGPEFDLSQKKQPQPYFGANDENKEATTEIDMSPAMSSGTTSMTYTNHDFYVDKQTLAKDAKQVFSALFGYAPQAANTVVAVSSSLSIIMICTIRCLFIF